MSSRESVDLPTMLDEVADRDLGTAVSVCDGKGRYDEASLLEVCELYYAVDDDNRHPQPVTPYLVVDPLLLGQVDDGLLAQLSATLQQLHPDGPTP